MTLHRWIEPRDSHFGNWIRKKLGLNLQAVANHRTVHTVLFPHSLSGSEGCRQKHILKVKMRITPCFKARHPLRRKQSNCLQISSVGHRSQTSDRSNVIPTVTCRSLVYKRKSYNKQNVHKLANTLLRTSLGSVRRALTCRGVILLLFQWSESFRWGIASRWRTCVWNSRAKLHCGNHWAHHSQCSVRWASERCSDTSGDHQCRCCSHTHTHLTLGYRLLIGPFFKLYMLDSIRFYISR